MLKFSSRVFKCGIAKLFSRRAYCGVLLLGFMSSIAFGQSNWGEVTWDIAKWDDASATQQTGATNWDQSKWDLGVWDEVTRTHLITPVVDTGGVISPSDPFRVDEGTTAELQVYANENFVIGEVGGTCEGSLEGNVFTTLPVYADCEVSVSFVELPPVFLDSDNDGVGDNADLDDDNDGFTDVEELEEGTDPLDAKSQPEIRGLNFILIKAAIDAVQRSI